MATTTSTPEAILDAVGGAENIIHFTHCATRLRFELKDASGIDKAAVEAIPGVMGAVPQSGDRYQIVIGGAVQSVYDEINNLPAMKSQGGSSGSGQSDADVKAAARAKARGKNAYVDAFFEYLSDSFRPLLPVLLGASLIIAGLAVLDSFGVINASDPTLTAADKPAAQVFAEAMFKSVFHFLPIMVAYNAAKKLNIDPWVGAAVMAALMTPQFLDLSKAMGTTCTHNATLNKDLCVAHVAGLPMQLNDYSGQVFVPLMMVAVLALVYKGLAKLIPSNVQMVFVPFFSFIIMMPVTAFIIGPVGVWVGTGLGSGLAWLNTSAPIVFAIVIPLLYPFLVPLGLHWPLNAIMLANISTLGYDFIQGPMGSWNFACFGATAGVLVLAIRDKDKVMRQTASGALAAGLFGGISEPSLYGIHLRFKRIYPFMLVGCAVGGLVQGIGSMLGGIEGVTTTTFAFTSLLTIPVFNPMWLYGIAVAAAFATSFFLIVTFGYRTKEERAEALAAAGVTKGGNTAASAPTQAAEAPKAAAAAAAPVEEGDRTAKAPTPKPALVPGAVTEIASPLKATTMDLDKVPDPVFSSGAVGQGVGLEPQGDIVVTAPADGTVVVAPSSGHAFGITLDSGVEILIHVGLDTVNLEGQGFDVKVSQGDRVSAGQELVRVDRSVIEQAGYPLTTPVLVTNTASFASVEVVGGDSVEPGEALIKVTAPEA